MKIRAILLFTFLFAVFAVSSTAIGGGVFRDCHECPEMVVVPAGTFMMGSPQSERGRRYNEGPLHQVIIASPFAVGKYEVTFRQWDACAAAGGCNGYKPRDEGWGRGDRPVINVNWFDAQSYVNWLSRRTGMAYRLLSESEWEYAARAGTTGPFHFGSMIATYQANYNGYYIHGNGPIGIYRGQTVPVGSFPPNFFGLHDMHGNVHEWVEDCAHDSYQGVPSDGSAWTNGDACARIWRGGSWSSGADRLRSASRQSEPNLEWLRAPGYHVQFGFRVARTLFP